MKKTAVEWLEKHLIEYGFDLSHHKLEINQAKEKEKQQIIDSYQQGFNNAYFNNPFSKEEYYNETFNK